MPSQPAWFHRLDEIFTMLQGIEATHLDRQAVERPARSWCTEPSAMPTPHP